MGGAIDPKEQEALHQRFLHFKDLIIDSNKRATDLGIASLKIILAINGAGAIALLAFIGQIAFKEGVIAQKVLVLLTPLKILIGGILTAAIASGLGYFRMFFESLFYEAEINKPGTGQKWIRAAMVSLYLAFIMAVSAYVIFGYGMMESAAAIKILMTVK